MNFITKLFKKEEVKEENKALKVVLWIFLIVGIAAGICVIAKVLYDKYTKKLDCFEDEDDCCFDDLLDDCDDCDCICECDCDCDETPAEEEAPCCCCAEEAPAEA